MVLSRAFICPLLNIVQIFYTGMCYFYDRRTGHKHYSIMCLNRKVQVLQDKEPPVSCSVSRGGWWSTLGRQEEEEESTQSESLLLSEFAFQGWGFG